MRTSYRLGATLLALTLSVAAQGQPPDAERVDALILQMGSERFAERARAMLELEAVGAPALEPLRRASKACDLETARRAAELVRRIEEQILVQQALAPKKLHLRFAETPALDAVAELSKQSGYAVPITGDRTLIVERKVTLDTGDITFWEAVDRLGAKAGVTLPPSASPAQRQAYVTLRNRPPVFRGGARTVSLNAGPTVEQIFLRIGAPARHVSYAGAVRIELRVQKNAETGACQLVFDASAEPRLQSFSLIGSPNIQRAVDELDRPLELSEPNTAPVAVDGNVGNGFTAIAVPAGPRRQALLQLSAGEPTAKRIKELSGVLPARASMPNELLANIDVASLMGGSGQQIVQAKNGSSISVSGFEKLQSGDYRVNMVVETTAANPGAANVVFNGNVLFNGNIVAVGGVLNNTPLAADSLPELRDAAGRRFEGLPMSHQLTVANNQMTRQMTVQYRPVAGVGDPTHLVYYGSRSVMIPVPFAFRDVTLD
jgi:hypothetical protein